MLSMVTNRLDSDQAVQGIGTALMLSPLAADISLAAEQLEKEHEGIFGPNGPDSQAYGLFNSAHAAGLVLGPAFAGAVYDKAGWNVAVWALAGLCASGIPVVMIHDTKSSVSPYILSRCSTDESIVVLHWWQESSYQSCVQSRR